MIRAHPDTWSRDEHDNLIINGGIYIPAPIKPPAHKCPIPHRGELDDIWTCACGQLWKFGQWFPNEAWRK